MSVAPLVSIVIPCFNSGRTIAEAIESALRQTYGDPKCHGPGSRGGVEVLVIDDGSTDDSMEVTRSFGERVRWETGPNRGAGAARNRGLALSKGELVQFLDADDILHPQKLAVQVAEYVRVFGGEMTPRASAEVPPSRAPGIVFCDGEVKSADGRVVETYRRALRSEHDPVAFVLGGVLPTPQPMHWRANLLAVGGFREQLPCAQERDLHLRLACAGVRFHHLPQTLCTIRRQAGSVSSDSMKVLDQHADIVRRAYESLRKSGGLTDERARAMAGLLASDGRAYLRHGLPGKAAEYFDLARRMHPDGGLTWAYRRPARMLRRVVGPAWAERLVGAKRRLVENAAL